MEEQGPALEVGREVRLRFLEAHRLQMGKAKKHLQQSRERIKSGDRAAHRGRPVVDAWLCLTGEMSDRAVYVDLYGVSPEKVKEWMNIPQIIQVAGFRASLQSGKRLTGMFQTLFEHLLEMMNGLSSAEVKKAFEEDSTFQQQHHRLVTCFDDILDGNPLRRQELSPREVRKDGTV